MSNRKFKQMDIEADGGQSLDSFHSQFQIRRDVEFVKKILPYHYIVEESEKQGSLHCVSKIGIRLPPYKNESSGNMVSDAEDEEHWDLIVKAIKQHFGERFQEIYHNVCFCHTDFTIYLKPATQP